MLVELTRAGLRAAIVETHAIELGHAGDQCSKVREIEQRFLRFEATGDDQEMMVDDVELVEQGDVSVREIGHKEVWIIRKERIDRAARRRPSILGACRASSLRARLETWRTRKRTPLSSISAWVVSIGRSAPQRSACSVWRRMAGHSVPGWRRRCSMVQADRRACRRRACRKHACRRRARRNAHVAD